MDREKLIRDVRETLSRAGFFLTDHGVRTVVFDIVARRDRTLLLVKVLVNVDALTRVVGAELRVLGQRLGGSALVVGARTSLSPLEDGTLYNRHELPIVTLQTLVDHFIEGVPPFVFAAPGGPYVRMDGATLSRLRQERGLSLGDLAAAAGVSRKAIQLYESGKGAVVDVAIRLEDFLGTTLVSPLDLLKPVADDGPPPEGRPATSQGAGFERTVFERLSILGFRVTPTARTPFAALSEQPRKEPGGKRTIVLTGVAPTGSLRPDQGWILHSIARVAEQDSMIVLRRPAQRAQVEGTPLIAHDELDRLRGAEEVLGLIRERRIERP